MKLRNMKMKFGAALLTCFAMVQSSQAADLISWGADDVISVDASDWKTGLLTVLTAGFAIAGLVFISMKGFGLISKLIGGTIKKS